MPSIRSTLLLSKSFIFSATLLFLSIGSSISTELRGQKQNILGYSYSGSSEFGSEYIEIMENPEVQQLLLDMAKSPRSTRYVENALKEIDVALSNLLQLNLIQQDGNQYKLSFILYTREDMDIIRAVAEDMGKILAEGILAKQTEIEDILKSDLPSEIDWRETAFFIIGCVSLDWDGLRISRKNGFLTQPRKDEFIPQAIQPGGGGSNRELYWGSHNNHSPIAITSFGDHSSMREILPDISWRMKVDAVEPLNSSLIDAASRITRLGVGRIMISLRESDLSLSELSEKIALPERETESLIKLLQELDYIIQVGSKYRAKITVLTEQDRMKVNQLRQIGKSVIHNWYTDYYSDLYEGLSKITPVKYGVSLADGFYWIWHYIFGIANRELVRNGLFADPYDSDRRFQGYIPAVYLYDVVTDPL